MFFFVFLFEMKVFFFFYFVLCRFNELTRVLNFLLSFAVSTTSTMKRVIGAYRVLVF